MAAPDIPLDHLPELLAQLEQRGAGLRESHFNLLSLAPLPAHETEVQALVRMAERCRGEAKDLSLADAQLRRWRAAATTDVQRHQLARFGPALERYRAYVTATALATERLLDPERPLDGPFVTRPLRQLVVLEEWATDALAHARDLQTTLQQAGGAVHNLDDELRERLAWTQARAGVDARALLITAGHWAAQPLDPATRARLAELTRDLSDLIGVAAEIVALTQPHLLWTAAKSGVCPVCGGVVRAQPTALHVGFQGQTFGTLTELGRCQNCRRHLGDLHDLLAFAAEVGQEVGAIETLTFGPVPVKADVWLGPALGAIPFQTYQANLASAQALQAEAPGTPAEVGVLPALGEPWALAQVSGPLDWTPQGQRRGAWLTLVVLRGGGVRAWALNAQAPTVDTLRALVLDACAKPMVGPPGRPAALLVETPALHAALGPALAGARVKVQVGTLEAAQQALGAVLAGLQG